MGFNLTEVTNQNLGVSEQSAYDLIFKPVKASEVYMSTGTVTKWINQVTGGYWYSATSSAYIKYTFRGNRVGIMVVKASGNGKLSFDIDGVAYPTYDTNSSDGNSYANVPYIIANDLDDTEHILTVMKVDSNGTNINGFLIDNASNAPHEVFATINDHASLLIATPFNIGTTDSTYNNQETWVSCITFTNTTASPINVTLKNSSGTVVVGPFPIPANDIRQLLGKIYFAGGIKVVASATGCFMTVGGQ